MHGPRSRAARGRPLTGFRAGGLALVLALATPSAIAQLSSTVIAVSDYRYRGVSLSREKPALQLSATWDDPGGAYAGLFTSSVQFPQRSLSVQAIGFAGYAARLGTDVSADIGGQYTAFAGSAGYDYAELYAGATWQALSARLHYARRYFGVPGSYWYAELDANRPLTERFTVAAHAGLLVTPPARADYAYYMPGASEANPVDVRLTLAADVAGVSVQLSWVANTHPAAAYPFYEQAHARAVVLSAAYAF